MKLSEVERFEKHIFYSPCGCWYWTGNQRKKTGYGGFRFNGKMMLSHRVSWLLFKGEIGENHVLHKCDNPSCVNPDHLFLGTHVDNMNDMKIKGRAVSFQGSLHANSILTESEVLDIKKLLNFSHKQVSIAKTYGVDKTTIQNISSGKTWKHVQV